MTIDTSVAIAGGTVILGIMGWLIVKIVQLYEKKMSEAMAAAKSAAENAERKIKELETKLETACQLCRAHQDDEHKTLHTRITEESRIRAADLKALEKEVNDVAVTSAGIGATYATRDELNKSMEGILAELKERGGKP
jgi:Tfp pilus assembly major pilin PilA